MLKSLDAAFNSALSMIPNEVRVTMEIVGWGFALALCFAILLRLIEDMIEKHREKKLAREVNINPEAAYRQIIAKQKAINKLRVEAGEKLAKKCQELEKELQRLQKDFKKNFPYVEQGALENHIAAVSAANR